MTPKTPMVMINVEDIQTTTEAYLDKIFDALPLLGEITLLEKGEPVGVLMSIEKYNTMMSLIGGEII